MQEDPNRRFTNEEYFSDQKRMKNPFNVNSISLIFYSGEIAIKRGG